MWCVCRLERVHQLRLPYLTAYSCGNPRPLYLDIICECDDSAVSYVHAFSRPSLVLESLGSAKPDLAMQLGNYTCLETNSE